MRLEKTQKKINGEFLRCKVENSGNHSWFIQEVEIIEQIILKTILVRRNDLESFPRFVNVQRDTLFHCPTIFYQNERLLLAVIEGKCS